MHGRYEVRLHLAFAGLTASPSCSTPWALTFLPPASRPCPRTPSSAMACLRTTTATAAATARAAPSSAHAGLRRRAAQLVSLISCRRSPGIRQGPSLEAAASIRRRTGRRTGRRSPGEEGGCRTSTRCRPCIRQAPSTRRRPGIRQAPSPRRSTVPRAAPGIGSPTTSATPCATYPSATMTAETASREAASAPPVAPTIGSPTTTATPRATCPCATTTAGTACRSPCIRQGPSLVVSIRRRTGRRTGRRTPAELPDQDGGACRRDQAGGACRRTPCRRTPCRQTACRQTA